MLDADLSPHQAVFNDSASSDPKTEAACFNTRMSVPAARGYSRFNAGVVVAVHTEQKRQGSALTHATADNTMLSVHWGDAECGKFVWQLLCFCFSAADNPERSLVNPPKQGNRKSSPKM